MLQGATLSQGARNLLYVHLNYAIGPTDWQSGVTSPESLSLLNILDHLSHLLPTSSLSFIAMAEGLGAAGSIVSIVAYGLQLAASLQTYEQGYSSAKEKLCELGVDISATASALLQLQHVIESDKDLSTKVLKDEGVEEIENVAAQCENIYKTVIILVNKAGKSANKGKIAADFGDRPVLKPSNLLWDLRWKWLSPRVKRIQEQIRWVKMKILLNLQLAGLAKVQLGLVEL